MQAVSLQDPPGFRRRFRITPLQGKVCAEVEDDFHCMGVSLYHANGVVKSVEPVMRRVPWTTCPGAEKQLQDTFAGVALKAFAVRGQKKQNCTHLYDLALLAATHAGDEAATVYDVLVADPEDGKRKVELRRNGTCVLSWVESSFTILEPVELAGMPLVSMRSWIDALDELEQEYARILQWANMIANGRIIPMDQQSDATKMPANCYTFQPDRAAVAERVGKVVDFSAQNASEPLAGYEPFA